MDIKHLLMTLALLSLGLFSMNALLSADANGKRHSVEKGCYVVMGRVVSGTLIANFGLNIGDIVIISDDAKTMTVSKSGRKFPVGRDEPNLMRIDDRLAQLREAVNENAKNVASLKDSLLKNDAETKDAIAKMEALIASAPSSNIYLNNGSGLYVVGSQTNMSNEQQQLFHDLNKMLGSLRREAKQLQKQIPDAEAALDRDRKTLAHYEAELAAFLKDNPQPEQEQAVADANDASLRDRLAKLKSLFNDGLITKEQYDRSVKDALDSDASKR